MFTERLFFAILKDNLARDGGEVTQGMAILYKLEKFEGPLDLLLHLIEKNKVDIRDIPVVEITRQYLEYVRHMEREDLDIVSDFLVMAATLLDIKSRMLLPVETDEEEGEKEDPRAELAARLMEYRKFKVLARELAEMEKKAEGLLFRPPSIPKEVARYEPPPDLDRLLDGLTLARLQQVFNTLLRRQEERIDPIRSKFGTITREPVSLEMRVRDVMNFARLHRYFSFRQMLERRGDRLEIVVTFLAVLELMKIGKIYLTQETLFGDMAIEIMEKEGEETELALDDLKAEYGSSSVI